MPLAAVLYPSCMHAACGGYTVSKLVSERRLKLSASLRMGVKVISKTKC